MRKVLPVVAIFCLAALTLNAAESHHSADELLPLHGIALFKAADEIGFEPGSEFSTTDLIKVAAKLGEELKNVTRKEGDTYAFGRFFEAACERASPEEIDQLVDIYVRLEPGSFDKGYSFQPLAMAWVARELAALSDTAVALPEGDEALPPKLRDAPADLVAAWQLYKRATRPASAIFRHISRENEISFQANEAAFYRLIDDDLLKRGEKIAERLWEFGWSGWSGTGSDSLTDPPSKWKARQCSLRERRRMMFALRF